MKFIKSIALALACTFATASYAEGIEEVCHNRAEINVRLKHALVNDPGFLAVALERNEKAKIKPEVKALVRENYFWVNNRKNMSDEDIRRLSFISCLSRFM